MIPAEVKKLMEQRPGKVTRSNRAGAERALSDLGVPLDSEFAQFYLAYQAAPLESPVSDERMVDVTEPRCSVAIGTRFAHDAWDLPDKYVAFTTMTGEGAYLYDRETGQVWDFELASRDAFLAGKQRPSWNSFFEFMTWFLGGGK